MISTEHCLICLKKNKTIYWHRDSDSGDIWCWCNACDRGYSLREYCNQAGISLPEFLKGEFNFKESASNEVQAQAWPTRFIPLSDPRAHPAVDYIKSRGLTTEGDYYYDMERHGIVFPYYFGNHFCGAQTRFIVPRVSPEGEVQKIDTMPGTRLGLLIYGWNQERFVGDVKAVVVTEGAFNALSIQQALNSIYGGIANNPWRVTACSGSGATQHHKEAFKELKDNGIRIVIAPDSDDAGFKMLKKYQDAEVCTHYAITEDPERDWNDMKKGMSDEEFAHYFISKVKRS
jgi:hypothetical protein